MKIRDIILLICLTISLSAVSQQLEVESVEPKPFDMGAAHKPRIDLAGVPCALVRVEFTSPNAKIQGNVVGEIEYDVSEYLVYCSAGTKELRVLHPRMRPTRIYFPDYGIDGLDSKVTYSVVLNFPRETFSQQVRQSDVANDYIYPFKDSATGYYGFRNMIDEVVVPPKYEKVDVLSDNLYTVVEGGRVGFLDAMGRQVLKCEYDFIWECGDHFIIKKDGLWGMVAADGSELLPLTYKQIYPFAGKGAMLVDGEERYGWYDRNKKEIVVPCLYECLVAPGLLYADFLGNEFKNPSPSDRLIGMKKDGKWGFVEYGGRVAIPFIYEDNEVVGLTADVYNFINGRATVMKNGKWGMIDEQGNVVLPFEYTRMAVNINLLDDIYYIASKSNGKSVILNTDGKPVCKEHASFNRGGDGFMDYSDGGDKFGLINVVSGREITPAKYDNIGWPENGFTRVYVKGQGWNLVDRAGNELFSGYYDEVGDMKNGFVRVRPTNGKYGFFDRNAHQVIGFKYDDAGDFGPDKLAKVKQGDKWGCINTVGTVVIPFDSYEEVSGGLSSHDGKLHFRRFKKDGKWGYYGNGEWIIPCQYTDDTEVYARLRQWCRTHNIKLKD